MRKIIIGIDPGAETGFAVWDTREKRFRRLATTDFWSCYQEVLTYNTSDVEIYIEDPSLNKPTFARSANAQAMQKISQNVGMNKMQAQLLIIGFQLQGYTVRPVRPSQTKWSPEMFRRVTGIPSRVSQHIRDAARLVYGM